MTSLVFMMHSLHQSLLAAEIPHAFGGALALAWCVEEARGTQDVDLNVFVSDALADTALAALPADVAITATNRMEIARDGQSRLWWDQVPVDVFFNTTPFHEAASTRVRWDEVGGVELPFLDCGDLAVFKAFFNRTKDWLDLAVMLHAGTLDTDALVLVLTEYLGADDERIARVKNLQPESWS